MRAVLIVLGLLAVLGAVLVYSSEARQDRLEYEAGRVRWHQDCDALIGQTGDDATACAKRLTAMRRYARQRGW